MLGSELGSVVYGPVASWRLGRSLGIDLVSTPGKTCSFDCAYCQLGKTVYRSRRRREFVSMDRLCSDLERGRETEADYVTFSGVAEPTLASNLGQALDLAKSTLGLPAAVLTNASLMSREDVRQDLAHADVVVAKLDAPDEALFRAINRPVRGISWRETLDGIKAFRRGFSGILALQMMFLEANRDRASEMAALAEDLSPAEVQINTPLRPCAVDPLSREAMADVKAAFRSLPSRVVMVYEASKPGVTPINLEETLRRRPQL